MKPSALEQAAATLQVAPIETLGSIIAWLVVFAVQVSTPFGAVSSTAALIAIICNLLLARQIHGIKFLAIEKAKNGFVANIPIIHRSACDERSVFVPCGIEIRK